MTCDGVTVPTPLQLSPVQTQVVPALLVEQPVEEEPQQTRDAPAIREEHNNKNQPEIKLIRIHR